MSERQISGVTRTVFVVGDPVWQLRTPQALNELWNERGKDFITVPAHVTEGDLPAFLEGIRADSSALGAVLTVPHKEAAFALCVDVGENARITGAVNAIRREETGRLVGETFDGMGFVAGLEAAVINPQGMSVLIIGAGGAAGAVAAALAKAGASRIQITNRTSNRAKQLVERLRRAFPTIYFEVGARNVDGLDLLVNATTLGMNQGDPVSFDVSKLSSSTIVADVVASVEMTALLQAAQGRDLRVHGGRHMLLGQTNLIADYLAQL